MHYERKAQEIAAYGEQIVSFSEKRGYFLEVMSKKGPKVLENIGTIRGSSTGILGVALGVKFGVLSRVVFSGDACAVEFIVQIQDPDQKPTSIDRLYLMENDRLCEDALGEHELLQWERRPDILEWLLVRVADKIINSGHFAPAA